MKRLKGISELATIRAPTALYTLRKLGGAKSHVITKVKTTPKSGLYLRLKRIQLLNFNNTLIKREYNFTRQTTLKRQITFDLIELRLSE